MALFLGSYLVFLALGVPAGHLLSAANAGPVSYRAAQGALGRGAVSGLRFAGLDLGDYRWRIAPRALLGGCAALRFEGGRDGVRSEGILGTCWDGRRYLAQASARADAARVAARPPAPGAAVEGDLSATLERLVAARSGALEGGVRLVWERAALALPERLDLGRVAADLRAEADGLAGDLRGAGGDVRLDGTLRVDATGAYAVAGELTPRDAAAAAALERLLTQDGTGRFRFGLRGRLGQW